MDGLHESGRTNCFVPLGPARGEGDTLRGPAEDNEPTDIVSSLHDSPDNTEQGGDTGKRRDVDSEAGEVDLASICTIYKHFW